jgi:hypothetical protein
MSPCSLTPSNPVATSPPPISSRSPAGPGRNASPPYTNSPTAPSSSAAAATTTLTVNNLAGAAVDGILSSGGTRVGFLLRLSSNLQNILSVHAFADGKVESIDRVRSTEVPGQATGTLFISGQRRVTAANDDGYFVARLAGNYVASTMTGLSWASNMFCRARNGSLTSPSDMKWLQPWDVRSDGRVVYGSGESNGSTWAQIGVLDSAGQPTTMENWPNHWGSAGEQPNRRASQYAGAVTYSAIVLKAGRSGSLRSYNQTDFDAYFTDENGNPRKSKFPDDYYFSAPQALTGQNMAGPGYTGYSMLGNNSAARIGDVVIDRRNNDLYYGYNYQTRLPDGLPDFEPTVVAMDSSGNLKWWARMYREFTDSNNNGVYDAGEPRNSTPDQYVDALALDYAGNRLTVLARCHGNNVNNLYQGNALLNNASAAGFQNQWTGSSGNIHIHWLGKYGLTDGKLYHSTYVGDYSDSATGQTTTFSSGNLQGWANPNAGWPDLNTTRTDSYELAVDSTGQVYITALGRRSFTTSDAYQQQNRPSQGASVWASFVRVYSPTLSSLAYSSLLRGAWDLSSSSTTGNNTELDSFIPTSTGVIVVGYHEADSTTGTALGLPTPTQNVPSWGRSTMTGEEALLARLTFGSGDAVAPTVTTSTFAFNEAAARVKITFSETVTDVTAADLLVTRLSSNTPVSVANFSYDAATRTASFNLTTGNTLLANGNYRATLPAGSVRDSAGNLLAAASSFDFFSLAGDANRDRSVNFADLLTLAGNYNKTNQLWSDGDFNYDGAVNFTDVLILASNYNLTSPAAALAQLPKRRTSSVLD